MRPTLLILLFSTCVAHADELMVRTAPLQNVSKLWIVRASGSRISVLPANIQSTDTYSKVSVENAGKGPTTASAVLALHTSGSITSTPYDDGSLPKAKPFRIESEIAALTQERESLQTRIAELQGEIAMLKSHEQKSAPVR